MVGEHEAGGDSRPLQLLALLLLVLLAWLLRPVLGAIVFGGFIALVAHVPFERLVRALRGRRSLAAGLSTAALALTVLSLVGVTGVVLGKEARDALRWLARDDEAARASRALIERLPSVLADLVPPLIDSARETALRIVGSSPMYVPRALASTGHFLVSILLAMVTMLFSLRDGPALVSFLLRVSPLSPAQSEALLREFREVALGLFRGGALVGLFHGTAAILGLALFGIPQALLLGSLCAVASFVPVVGTGLIAAPLVIGLAMTGEVGKAIGLGIWFLAIVGAGDHLLRPLFSKGQMALPRPLLFLTLFGGLMILGPTGLLLGPLLGSLAVVSLRLLAA